MAVSQSVFDMTFVAGANLASSQYRFVTLDAAANTVKVCGTSDRPLGVLQNKPAAGEAATVRLLGTSKVSANGAFGLHDELKVAASDGEVDTVAGGEAWACGIALAAAGGAGEIVEMWIAVRPIGDADLATLLASVDDGTAGADLVGATPITETGAANTVQEILEALVTALKAVTNGASGADLVGATPIPQTGAANTVQKILEALVAALVSEADGASGADLVAATPITETGEADTVQEILETLVAALSSEVDGTSGADFVHCTGVGDLVGDTVQEVMESINAALVSLTGRVEALEGA